MSVSAPRLQNGAPTERPEIDGRIGDTINGRWTLKSLLGIGGMAAVYRAEDPDGVASALKIMHRDLAETGSIKERFLREARITSAVDHTGAIKIHEEGTSETGEAYFAMELLEGKGLDALWRAVGKKFPVREALHLISQALDVLHAYHQKGVVHRDLKPGNLFVTARGEVKILDFGAARARDAVGVTRDGATVGTPSYMAPEQAIGRDDAIDARTDVYAMGAVLFSLLAGRRVHEGRNSDEALVMAATTPADSLARHAADIPVPVVRLVDRALAWDREDRYRSAEQMRQAVVELLGRPSEEIDRRDIAIAALEGDSLFDQYDRLSPDDHRQLVGDRVETLRDIMTQLGRALDSGVRYGWSHDGTVERCRGAHERIIGMLDRDPDGVFWRVRPHSFDHGAEIIWEPRASLRRIPYNLFSGGFRHLAFRPGLTNEDLVRFLELITKDPDKDLPPEDDLNTAFWDLDCDGLEAKIVFTFDVDFGGDDADQLELDERDPDAGGPGGVIGVAGSGGAAEVRALEQQEVWELVDFFRDVPVRLPRAASEQLRQSLLVTGETWDRRIATMMGRIWEEGQKHGDVDRLHGTLSGLVADHLETGRLEALVRVFAYLLRVGDEDELAEIINVVFDEEMLERFLHDVLCGGRSGVARYEETYPKWFRKTVERLLCNLPERAMRPVLDAYESIQRPTRAMLVPFMKQHAAQNVTAIGRMLRRIDGFGGKYLIKMLVSARGEKAADVVRAGLENPDPAVETAALTCLCMLEVDGMLDEILARLDSGEPRVRRQVLEIVRQTELQDVMPVLLDRVRDKSFHDLPVTERQDVLRTIYSLSSSTAEEVAIELVKSHGMFARKKRESTRRLAVQMLNNIGSTPDALRAVKTAKKSRWWNSAEVQDLADTAIDRSMRG